MTMMEFNKNETLTFCTHLLICSTLHVSTYLIDLDEKALQPFYQKTMTLSLYLNLSQFNQSDQALLKSPLFCIWSIMWVYITLTSLTTKTIFAHHDQCMVKFNAPTFLTKTCFNIELFWSKIHLTYFHINSWNAI